MRAVLLRVRAEMVTKRLLRSSLSAAMTPWHLVMPARSMTASSVASPRM